MTVKIVAIVPAIALALSAATALAQPRTRPFAQFDQTSLSSHSTPLRPYDQASAMAANAAYVGDGSDPSYLRQQQELTQEPGYSISTGAVQVGDASAALGDGSDPSYHLDQTRLPREPGYSVGTGAARVSGT
jgi:hypothetical protein